MPRKLQLNDIVNTNSSDDSYIKDGKVSVHSAESWFTSYQFFERNNLDQNDLVGAAVEILRINRPIVHVFQK